MQIQLGKTLDVEVVERQLADLWKHTAADPASNEDAAVLRARVANLLVFVANETRHTEAAKMMQELTGRHPSRVLLLLGQREAADRDIELSIDSFCETDKRTRAKRLCGEQVTLSASGKFRAELPSAALPLLVSDLPTFLWWRDKIDENDKVFSDLVQAADRLVIDSAEFADPARELVSTRALFKNRKKLAVGISDLNWARLTSWRALLANFYDVPSYQPWLDAVDEVQIDYVAPDETPKAVAPQALLFAGWLASRLKWTVEQEPMTRVEGESTIGMLDKDGRTIKLHLNRVDQGERPQGRLVRVELRSRHEGSGFFRVSRSDDNVHLLSEAETASGVHRGRVLPVRNRSAAQLLSREMEILSNDNIYGEAVAFAARSCARL